MPKLTLSDKIAAIERHRAEADRLFHDSFFELSIIAASFGYRLTLEPIDGANKAKTKATKSKPLKTRVKPYSVEIRREARKLADDGVGYEEIAAKLGITSRNSVAGIVFKERHKA